MVENIVGHMTLAQVLRTSCIYIITHKNGPLKSLPSALSWMLVIPPLCQSVVQDIKHFVTDFNLGTVTSKLNK